MYIVIVGAGKVGYSLYQDLREEGHEVLVIEKDAAKCECLENEMGSALLCGNGCEVTVQTSAGVDRADIFIAITGEDEDNLAACQLAKEKFAVPQVISSINKPKNEHIFSKLGINCTVDVVTLILNSIKIQASIWPLITLLNVGNNKEIMLAKVATMSSKVAGRIIGELALPSSVVVSLLIRGEEARIPSPDTVLEMGDELVFWVSNEDKAALHTFFTG
jgi:trk system potassium uptake protein TrkA